MAQFTIVGKKFSPSAFADYVAHVPLGGWKPKGIVLHNTWSPTLAQRPHGLTRDHIENLHHFYQFVVPTKKGKGWTGGPHLFVDQEGIWVFNPFDRPGVHSPSFNRTYWGVEMLGDYDKEDFDSGDGLRIQNHAMSALASMFRRLEIATVNDVNFRLHKDDKLSSHKDCPGKSVDRTAVKTTVQSLLTGASTGVWPEVAAKVVVYRKSSGQSPFAVLEAALRNGSVFADAQELSKATGIATSERGMIAVRSFVEAKFALIWKAETNRVYLGEL